MKAYVSTTMDEEINGFIHLTAENIEDRSLLVKLCNLDLGKLTSDGERFEIDLAPLHEHLHRCGQR